MKIYVSPFSSNARKVLMAASQLGIDCERVEVDLLKGGQRTPEFLALNPGGKVPVLVDGDFVLTESQAIMAYLADKTSGQTLYPTELRARSDVNRWLFWSANHWEPTISVFNWERVVKRVLGLGGPEAALVARAEVLFGDFAKVLDAHLAKREWISGDGPTLADIAVACPLTVATTAELPLAPYANVQRWLARVQELESSKKSAA